MKDRFDYRTELPTVDEMRRVARYLDLVLGLHSSAGKLLYAARLLEEREKMHQQQREKI